MVDQATNVVLVGWKVLPYVPVAVAAYRHYLKGDKFIESFLCRHAHEQGTKESAGIYAA